MQKRSQMSNHMPTGYSVSVVCISVFGYSLDFDEITRRLGVQPSQTARRVSRNRRPGEPACDRWSLSTPLAETEPLSAHLVWLWEVLKPNLEFLRSLRRTAEVRIYCGLNSGYSGCRVSFSPDALRLFVQLGIPLGVTIFMAP